MPGKKKKEAKAKGGKDGEEGKLPPPPQLDDQRQGALEAFLEFKITGKEEMVNLYQEEAEVFKEKNYHHKERNYQLKLKQEVHYKELVESAKKYEDELDKTEVVERDRVDEALTEKLDLTWKFAQELKDMEIRIQEFDSQLETESAELKKWRYFRDVTKGRNEQLIESMKQRMEDMEREAEELKRELEAKLEKAKVEITKKSEAFAEKQKELISNRLLASMDEASLGEVHDNSWLHKQIEAAKKFLKSIKEETSALELRNLEVMEMMTSVQLEEAELTKELMRSSAHKGPIRPSGSTSELPSLVDVAKCPSDEGRGQLGQNEMKLLAVQGSKAPFNVPPETFHLPPIEEQRSTHTALPPRTNWPISYSMLKSVV